MLGRNVATSWNINNYSRKSYAYFTIIPIYIQGYWSRNSSEDIHPQFTFPFALEFPGFVQNKYAKKEPNEITNQ